MSAVDPCDFLVILRQNSENVNHNQDFPTIKYI